MARRKNTRFIDPRYFLNEKMERLDEQVTAQAIQSVMGDFRNPAELYIDDDGQPLYIRLFIDRDAKEVVINYGRRQGGAGMNIGTAQNVAQALKFLQQRKFDLSKAKLLNKTKDPTTVSAKYTPSDEERASGQYREGRHRKNEKTLNEFELGFDLDDESDEELMRDQECVEREKKKLMPAVEAVIKFLESDEPQALGIERSTLHRYKKFLNPLVRLLNADQEYLVKLYRASRDEREGRTPMAEQSRRVEDSVVVQQAKEKGFPLAAAAAMGLATLDTTNGPTLLQNANKYIYKGKLGELIQGAQGIYVTLDQMVRNFRGKRQAPAAAAASPEQDAPKQSASKQQDPAYQQKVNRAMMAPKQSASKQQDSAYQQKVNRAMMGRLEEAIKKELRKMLRNK